MFLKRLFDLLFCLTALPFALPIIAIGALVAGVETRSLGIESTMRVGRYGKPFRSYRIRTHKRGGDGKWRLTSSGRLFSLLGIDTWPDLFNVLLGRMSIVGPEARSVEESSSIVGEDKVILNLRPGMTGPSSIKYRHLENILAKQQNPEVYEHTIVLPDKIKLEKNYYYHYTLLQDIKYLFLSALPFKEMGCK